MGKSQEHIALFEMSGFCKLSHSCNVYGDIGFLSCSKLPDYKGQEGLTSVELLDMIMA